MLRTIRAFVWMRWRVVMNAFKTRQRDSLEQIARALGALAPFFMVLVLIPTVVGLSLGAFFVGFRMGAAGSVLIFESWAYLAMRIVLGVATLVVLIAPMVRSSRGTGSETTRLLLLPIRRGMLHASEVIGALSDPWLGVLFPALILFPVGLMAGGSLIGGAFSLVGSLLFFSVVMLAVSLMSFAIGLIFRKRNRAEWVMVAVITLLSMSGLILSGFSEGWEEDLQNKKDEVQSGLLLSSQQFDNAIPAATRLLPSEIFMRLVAADIDGDWATAGLQFFLLSMWAGVLYAGSRWTHTRLLETPETGGSGKTGAGLRIRSIPGVSADVSAVALATMRLALRTVRGKTGVYLNSVVIAMVYVLLLSELDLVLPHGIGYGMGIGLVGCIFSLLSLQPILANVFAIDANGLTLQMLGPLSTRALLRGKMVGGALLTAIATGLCFLAGLALDPSGSPVMWLAAILIAVSLYLTFGPLGLMLSAVFPKAADLSRLGKDGNPQPIAAFIGFFAVPLLIMPPALLMAVTLLVVQSVALTAAAAAVWFGLSVAICALSLRALEGLFERRRENLLLVATGH